MRNIFILVSFAAFISCNQQNEKKETGKPVSVDSLTAVFMAGWNNKDSAAIMKTIAANAVVMNDSLIQVGTNAIANNWISGGVKVLSNIRTTSSIKNIDGNLAYDAGTYTLDLTPPGGPVLKERGNYSFVWTRQENMEWKLTLVHIEDVTRLPDIK